jgi:hypothetical protein
MPLTVDNEALAVAGSISFEPRGEHELDQILARLDKENDRFEGDLAALQLIANRLFGGALEQEETVDVEGTSDVDGAIALVHARLDRLGKLRNLIDREVVRLQAL